VLLALALPMAARADDGHLEKLNGSQIAYRLQGVALVKDSSGNRVEASLADAPLGAGDRVRYLIIATNQGSQPQVPGVVISIPEFTVWEPPKDVSDADILEWSTDGTHWQAGMPKHPAQVRKFRWALSDVLMPKMSTAFGFQLRLTGPYSDRTGDLNATRLPDARPLVAMASSEIKTIQTEHADHPVQRGPGETDPLKIGALMDNSKTVVDYNGLKMVEIALRNEVAYRATGTATVRAPNGATRTLPVSQTRLGVGDRVSDAFLAQNIGDVTRMAGATFVLPSYARFSSANTRGDGIIEVTDDFTHWYKPSQISADRVRGVRWAYDGKLNARQSAAFQVLVDVIGTPNTEDLNSPSGGGTFEALSPSAIQSLKFTSDLSASAANAGRDIQNQIASIGNSYDGVPLTAKLADSVTTQVVSGVVKSDATPVPTPTPRVDPKAGSVGGPDASLAALFVGGGVLALVCYLFSRASSSGNNPNARPSGSGGFKVATVGGRNGGAITGRSRDTAATPAPGRQRG
jgi:hypothetical protein